MEKPHDYLLSNLSTNTVTNTRKQKTNKKKTKQTNNYNVVNEQHAQSQTRNKQTNNQTPKSKTPSSFNFWNVIRPEWGVMPSKKASWLVNI